MHFNAHPPTKHHSAHTVSQATARAFIGRYLARARAEAAFRPDADFTQTGVAFWTHSADLGLGLKGLVDFEAGLRGKRVYDAESIMDDEPQGSGSLGGEWMDKDQFERMQEEEVGGGEEGKQGTKEGEDISVQPTPATDATEGRAGRKEAQYVDKEQRKALKKARRKEERRAMAHQAEAGNG